MHFNTVDDILLSVSVLSAIVLFLIFLLKKFHQPYTIAYILAGILIGPHFLKVFTNAKEIAMLGEIGMLLHLFFMGTEIEIPDSKTALLKPVIAQAVKMILSALAAWLIGDWLHWSAQNMLVLFGILIFNSTGIVSEYLRRTGELQTVLGKTTLNVLVLQDLLFGPILIGFQLFENNGVNKLKVLSALAVCVFVFWSLWIARNRRRINIPRLKEIEHDHELQVFFGFVICAGFALLGSKLGLTASFGGFIAGIFISRTAYLNWLEKILRPYHVFFLCLFFLSVGLALDVDYVLQNMRVILLLAFSIMLINSVFSALAFKLLKYSWSNSFYAGALMAQIGEYSLLISSIAFSTGIITGSFYKNILSACCLSILFSTVWITLMRAFIFKEKSFLRQGFSGLLTMVKG